MSEDVLLDRELEEASLLRPPSSEASRSCCSLSRLLAFICAATRKGDFILLCPAEVARYSVYNGHSVVLLHSCLLAVYLP